METSRSHLWRTLVAALLASVLLTGALAGCVVVETEQAPPGDVQPPDEEPGTGDQNGYAFMHTRDDGEPIRWSTCEPIRYVVREQDQPEGAQELLEDSVQRLSEATGLEFSYEGTTDEGPAQQRELYQPDRYGDVWAPVLIAYSTADEYEPLDGQAVGFGGPAFVRAPGQAPRYVSGMAVVDVETLGRIGGDEALQAVLLHELGHVLGLAHVDDPGQLMNPVQYGRQVTTFQDGDLRGLEVLGDGECHDPIEPRSVG